MTPSPRVLFYRALGLFGFGLGIANTASNTSRHSTLGTVLSLCGLAIASWVIANTWSRS